MLDQLLFWHWLALGLALCIAEILIPGTYLLWLGFGAAATGLVVLVAGPFAGWKIQLVIFAAFSVVSLLAGRWVMKRGNGTSDHPGLNRRADRLIGRRSVLEHATSRGRGRVRIDDTLWHVELSEPGAEAPKGCTVSVIAVSDSTLIVRPVKSERT